MRNVVITGGNKGIGLALTKLFLAAGDRVYVVARSFLSASLSDPTPGDFCLSEHPNITCIGFDLTQIDQLPKLVKQLPKVDVLINNAGILQPNTLGNYPTSAREASLALNLIAPIQLVELLSDKLLAPSDYLPRIVNNASIAGQIGHPDIWYGVAKAGLINATKSLAKHFEGKVIINAVAPSPTETDMLDKIPKHRQTAFLKNTTANRFATAKEVAETLYWLATDSPTYINGSCIDINNGSFPR